MSKEQVAGATEEQIVVYGALWCPDVRRTIAFLDQHQIPYTRIDTDEKPEARAFVKQVTGTRVIIPTLAFPDGSTMVDPSIQDLVEKLGLSGDPSAPSAAASG